MTCKSYKQNQKGNRVYISGESILFFSHKKLKSGAVALDRNRRPCVLFQNRGRLNMAEQEEEGLVAKRTAQYIGIRDLLKKMDDDYEKSEARVKLVELKALLEGYFEKVLTQTGVKTLVSNTGTVHWNTRHSCPLEDPQAFMDFVIQNQQFDLLDRRANVTAVREYAKEHGVIPPGANPKSIRTVGARKPGEKAKRGED